MPTKSIYPDIELAKTDIFGFLFERKDKPFPDDHVIYVENETGRSYTYTQVRDAAIDFGKGLRGLWDWQKGDVIAIFAPNCIDTPVVMWGCHWATGVVTPANPAYTAEELAFQLKDSGARAICTTMAVVDTAMKAADMVGIPFDRVIVMGPKDESFKYKHFSSIRNTSGATRYRRKKADVEDLAFLPYSSGTTGKPKGVMLCHRNVTSDMMQMTVGDQSMNWKEDRLAAILPFYHIYGLAVLVHQACYRGLQVHVMAKFDLAAFCQMVQDKKITQTYVAPPVLVHLGKSPIVAKYDLSSLKMLVSGAAPLTRELVEGVWDRLKIPTTQAYGLTETSPACHIQTRDTWQSKIGSVGPLLPNLWAKYMSPEEKELKAGEVGELWLKGPNIFKGYLNNEEGTKNALVTDQDGTWFKTGDVGYQDKDGAFFITDRVKELIKYKGFQVPPAELEGVLLGHPKVSDVAVVGLYNKNEATEVPRAYIVVAEGEKESKETADEIIKWMHSKVAHHKRLRGGIRFLQEIPKTASGKILRRSLKEIAAKADDEPKAKL